MLAFLLAKANILKSPVPNNYTAAGIGVGMAFGSKLKEALLDGNLAAARKLVNGGSHGLDRFEETFYIGDEWIV